MGCRLRHSPRRQIAQIQIHLADVVVGYVVNLQIEEDEAAQYAMIENEVNAVMGVVKRDAVLSPDKSEAFAQFEQKGLKVIEETGFEIAF